MTSVIRRAKSNYHKTKINDNSGNTRKTWEIINDVLGKNIHQSQDLISFQDKTTSDKHEIPHLFNDYFCSIASTLHRAIQPSPTPFTAYLPEPTNFSFFISPTSAQEIEHVIKSLKTTAPGYDMIDIRIVKRCSHIISKFLEHLINRSFAEGVFPKKLQIAKVIPIFKKGDKSLHTNYRPVSILPCFSKIIEKIMAMRLLNYLTNNSLLIENQYGFRPNYSTELAVQQLCQHMYDAIDNKLYQITIFCDLTKAFDTLSHSILLSKLQTYGIRGKANDWFKSYLLQTTIHFF